MALMYSPAGELGSPCPDFSLKNVEGKSVTLADFAKCEALVVMFICNHCPYVKAIEDRLIALAHDYQPRNVGVVGICSNNPADYPEDQPQELLKRWKEKNYDFPYLIDDTQEAARAFAAVCTPDLYVYDQSKTLRYRGRLDDSWKNPATVQRQELREALDSILAGNMKIPVQNPSMGCSIKW